MKKQHTQKKMCIRDRMDYAYYAWCLRKPEAIIAYQIGTGKDTPVHQKWAVNNCAQEITEAEARVAVCEEFGFEVSRVRIIGTPYYCLLYTSRCV